MTRGIATKVSDHAALEPAAGSYRHDGLVLDESRVGRVRANVTTRANAELADPELS